VIKFLKSLFVKNAADFEPLGLIRGVQLASVISGNKTFDGTVTITSGLFVSGIAVVTSTGTVNQSALPVATTGSVGVIRVGTGLNVDNQGLLSTTGSSNVVKFTTSIGDGENTDLLVTHNLGTRDLALTVLDNVTDEYVLPDIVFTTENSITFSFGEPPAVNQYRVIIVG
jgi:deoxyhypusine synthase